MIIKKIINFFKESKKRKSSLAFFGQAWTYEVLGNNLVNRVIVKYGTGTTGGNLQEAQTASITKGKTVTISNDMVQDNARAVTM